MNENLSRHLCPLISWLSGCGRTEARIRQRSATECPDSMRIPEIRGYCEASPCVTKTNPKCTKPMKSNEYAQSEESQQLRHLVDYQQFVDI
jgi:hypothetical protein